MDRFESDASRRERTAKIKEFRELAEFYRSQKDADDTQTQFENALILNKLAKCLMRVFFSWSLLFWMVLYLALSIAPSILEFYDLKLWVLVAKDFKTALVAVVAFLLAVACSKFIKDVLSVYVKAKSVE